MERMNNRMKPTRLVTREQNLAHIRGYDDNADGVLEGGEHNDHSDSASTYDPASRWQVIEGGKSSSGDYQIPDYNGYNDIDNDDYSDYPDEVENFSRDFNAERSQESRRKLIRRFVGGVAAAAVLIGVAFSANAVANANAPKYEIGETRVIHEGDTLWGFAEEIKDEQENEPADIREIVYDIGQINGDKGHAIGDEIQLPNYDYREDK